MTEYVEYTVEEVYNALKKDGFEHLRGQWTSTDMDGAIVGACVLGQTAINLGVHANSEFNGAFNLVYQLNTFPVDKSNPWAIAYDIDLPRGAGDTIIHWNDMEDDAYYDEYGDYDPEEEGPIWYLKTYAEVAKMAYEVLSPHFKETIKLAKREWKLPEVSNV